MDSMTGFGKAEVKTKIGKFTVEIASVNNRYLEISPRLPRQFFILEPKLRQLIGAKVNRGKINLYVGFEEPDSSEGKYLINKKAAVAYYRQLVELKKELKVEAPIDLHQLLLLPDVTRPENESIDENVYWPHLAKAAEEALGRLIEMRQKEGAAMARDMKKRLVLLDKLAKKIKKLAGQSVESYRDKLNKRLEELLNSPLPDTLRIEEQVAIMAERADISEECTRFVSHLEQYQGALGDREPAGKKLNFILQEMNREANTISSKSTDVQITSMVITIKEEVEKLRELVQNVE